ncbi:hypothetical protein M408DRAFT_247558 [Serendipita vermifera MAFF 305830]|uniref:CN hydrolase domain-containing protein n=1 Tax=Serendipita vermifera MAFF 305830 TaxID=933852 RepID=A0A0C2X3P5_SERVB|nr:hypothetical protein M408DRAFT_247558 [Serendipita vermifera MAFF 305830]
MLVAVAQICSTPSVARNLKICKGIIERAASNGARLVYLPEASDFIAPSADVLALSSPLHQSVFLNGIREAAKNSQTWIGVGVHERKDDPNEQRVYNTHLLIDPQGDIKGRYEKLHLFDVDLKGPRGPTLESKTTIAGKVILPPINTVAGKVGLLTCYDIRFPEPSLLLRQKGAEILTYPSAFTVKTGQAHWETLLRARAIETQSYVLAPAQIGEHFPNRSSYGRAMIVDAWGCIIADATDIASPEALQDGVYVSAEIDLETLSRIRDEMPLWNQRRSDVYRLDSTPEA